MMKNRILIDGSSFDVIEKVKKHQLLTKRIKSIAVFFENANFIITKYRPLNNGVMMILEFEDGTEAHIQSANCGYQGTGPHTSVRLLNEFGLDKEQLEALFFYNDAVQFDVLNNAIINIKTEFLFYPQIREVETETDFYNKIKNNYNAEVDLEESRVLLYNPQRTCWAGFLNLINKIENIEFSYYIGSDSPLEKGLYLDNTVKKILYMRGDGPDIKGVKHVNLVLSGSNFRVACMIDEEYEVDVIDATYLALTGERLFSQNERSFFRSKSVVSTIKGLLGDLRYHSNEKSDSIVIEKKALGQKWYG